MKVISSPSYFEFPFIEFLISLKLILQNSLHIVIKLGFFFAKSFGNKYASFVKGTLIATRKFKCKAQTGNNFSGINQ